MKSEAMVMKLCVNMLILFSLTLTCSGHGIFKGVQPSDQAKLDLPFSLAAETSTNGLLGIRLEIHRKGSLVGFLRAELEIWQDHDQVLVVPILPFVDGGKDTSYFFRIDREMAKRTRIKLTLDQYDPKLGAHGLLLQLADYLD